LARRIEQKNNKKTSNLRKRKCPIAMKKRESTLEVLCYGKEAFEKSSTSSTKSKRDTPRILMNELRPNISHIRSHGVPQKGLVSRKDLIHPLICATKEGQRGAT